MADTSVRDQLVADAKTLPGLIAAAQAADPALANVLLGKATSAAATLAGAVVTAGVAQAAAHYGLGWSGDIVTVVGGGVTLLAGLAINWLQVRLHIEKIATP